MGTEPQLIEQYVQTGKARLVYRHLVQLGAGSRMLAEASECAGEQGKFWELRELMYRRQGQLAGGRDVAALEPLSRALGIDHAALHQCIDDGRFRKQVEDDNAAAQREGVQGRPVMDIDGARIIGSQPIGAFAKVLDAPR
jgi:protein-disulfide isomerase